MPATVINKIGNKLTISVELNLSGSMLEMEEQILSVVNELGVLSTAKTLELMDTNGELLQHQGRAYSSKGKEKKDNESLRRDKFLPSCLSKFLGWHDLCSS
ncbi:MAG: hypothetical protein EAZ50_14045, partial [Runella slithyformis]